MKKLALTKGFFALVDDADYEWLSQHKWQIRFVNGRPYAQRVRRLIPGAGADGPRETIQMHRAIMRAAKGTRIDHVNGNGLDNRKSNLRFCSGEQNQWNRTAERNAISRYKGVSPFRHGRQPWRARIRANGKVHYLGYFKTEEEAARAYDKKAIELHGPFARLNFPLPNEAD